MNNNLNVIKCNKRIKNRINTLHYVYKNNEKTLMKGFYLQYEIDTFKSFSFPLLVSPGGG